MELRRPLNGAIAGATAAAVWAAQQPLDKRVFGSDYDDVQLLGKLVTRGPGATAAGLALHIFNGAVFGTVYALVRPVVPAPPLVTARPPGSASTSRCGRSAASSTGSIPRATSSSRSPATGARSPRRPGATCCSA